MNHLINILVPLSYLSRINVSLIDKLSNFLHEQFSKIFDNYIITNY
jgi:hypothetical protein